MQRGISGKSIGAKTTLGIDDFRLGRQASMLQQLRQLRRSSESFLGQILNRYLVDSHWDVSVLEIGVEPLLS